MEAASKSLKKLASTEATGHFFTAFVLASFCVGRICMSKADGQTYISQRQYLSLPFRNHHGAKWHLGLDRTRQVRSGLGAALRYSVAIYIELRTVFRA